MTNAKGLDALTEINKKMIGYFEFNEKITYKRWELSTSRSLTDGGVWGFVVNTDNDKKFRKGDILKSQLDTTLPARNAARGNILDGLHHQLD